MAVLKEYVMHSDTAQAYRNEEEAGKAIRESGLARQDIYITTKFSGRDGLGIEESIQNSLKNVRLRLLYRSRFLRDFNVLGLVQSWGCSMWTCT